MATLVRVVPTERWQLVLEFADGEHRLFDASVARADKGWLDLASPRVFKHLTFDATGVEWSAGRRLDVDYLQLHSKPASPAALASAMLTVGQKNCAPTPMHASHHVYGVQLFPFRPQPFEVGESIGGGHAEQGGSAAYDLAELHTWPAWRTHFEYADCAWAIPLIENEAEGDLIRSLIQETCRRAGGS